MRISDWSSDVCSSDLAEQRIGGHPGRSHNAQTFEFGALVARIQRRRELQPATKLKLVNERCVAGLVRRGRKIVAEIRRHLRRCADEVGDPAVEQRAARLEKIGSASCRERVCQYV